MKKIIHILTILLLILVTGYFILRYQFYFKYYDEVEFTRAFWTAVIENDTPSEELKKYLQTDITDRFNSNFYAVKVWFVTFGPVEPDSNLLRAENASMIYRTTNKEKCQTTDICVIFKYGDERQRLHAVLIKKNGEYRLSPSFSLDNCLWSPDYNNDGIVNNTDVIIAKNRNTDNK